MISTVTFSTVTIAATAAIAGSLALIVILVLLSLLIQKELATASDDSRMQRLSQVLNIAILPLLIAFFLIVVFRVVDVLN